MFSDVELGALEATAFIGIYSLWSIFRGCIGFVKTVYASCLDPLSIGIRIIQRAQEGP